MLTSLILDEMSEAMARVTHVDGQKLGPIYEVHFRGKQPEEFEWMFWAAKIQWGPTLAALIAQSGGLGGVMGRVSQSQSQSTSTG